MKRDVFNEEHELFRDQFRKFAAKEIEPKIEDWNARGMTDRETWQRMGEAGFLGAAAPDEYGGAGGDFLYDAIIMEELACVRAHGLMTSLHSDICLPVHRRRSATTEQKRAFLPRRDPRRDPPRHLHDRARHRLRPRQRPDDAHGATATTTSLNGAKTFISIGQIGDLFIVVAKTDPKAEPAHTGISLLLVEADTPGFVRGRKLEKLGLPAQDTSELFFEDCRVPGRRTCSARKGRASRC